MIECPYCYRVFRTSPEKLGARCPKCRMPLFDGGKRRRPEKELGPCALHPAGAAVANCGRCNRAMCTVCRTRWHEEVLCPDCVNRSLAADEPGPQEAQRQLRQGLLALAFAAVGWFLLLLTLWPMSTFHTGGSKDHWVLFAGFLFFGSFLPPLLALGQSAAALRLRGAAQKIATCGLVLAGSQLGVMLGLLILNVWQN